MVIDGWVARLRSIAARGERTGPSDGVFIIGDVPPATRAQHERLWWLVVRGRKALLVAAGLMVAALLIATARGSAGWSSWLIPVVALALAGVLELIDRRLSRRPPGSVEVPTDLADLIIEMYQIRDEIVLYGPDRLIPEAYEEAVEIVHGHVVEIVGEANRVLAAERAGDTATATALRADIDKRVETITDVYEDMDAPEDDADEDDARGDNVRNAHGDKVRGDREPEAPATAPADGAATR